MEKKCHVQIFQGHKTVTVMKVSSVTEMHILIYCMSQSSYDIKYSSVFATFLKYKQSCIRAWQTMRSFAYNNINTV